MTDSNLTKEDIRNISNLIKIFIPDFELDDYSDKLNTALDYAGAFDDFDLDEIDMASSSTGLINVYRDDAVSDGLTVSEALSNAHEVQGNLIVVQRVVRK